MPGQGRARSSALDKSRERAATAHARRKNAVVSRGPGDAARDCMERIRVPSWSQRLAALQSVCLLASAGCLTQHSVLEGGDGGSAIDPRLPAVTQPAAAANVCVQGGLCRAIPINTVDTMDLLFVLDDSDSMAGKQEALRAQLPHLISLLTTGQRSPMDPHPFPPMRSVHAAVVTGDMGLVGVSGVAQCDGRGDDGLLRDPAPHMCGGGSPTHRFLDYAAQVSDSSAFVQDLDCLAAVGTAGCGIQQPLEAAFNALSTRPENQGFLRNEPVVGASLVMIVILTDDDDCSTPQPAIFTPAAQLAQGDLGYGIDPGLRCARLHDKLYDVSERYAQAWKALRPDRPTSFVYGVIAGVPADLVNASARRGVDFSNEQQRDAYYDAILADPRMQLLASPEATPGMGNITPSCSSALGTANPPVRLVQLAKALGEQAVVSSICDADLGAALEPLIEKVATREHADCIDEGRPRGAPGKLTCNVIWELPRSYTGPDTTPTECGGAKPFLKADARYPSVDGRQRCVLTQLVGARAAGGEDGWYYDDAASEATQTCAVGTGRVLFTAESKPPSGVDVYLDCAPDAFER